MHSRRTRFARPSLRSSLVLFALTAAATTATAVSGAAAIETEATRGPTLIFPARLESAAAAVAAAPLTPVPSGAVEQSADAGSAATVSTPVPPPLSQPPAVPAAAAVAHRAALRSPALARAAVAATRARTAAAAVHSRHVKAIIGLGDSVVVGTGCRCANFISVLGANQAAAQGSDLDVRNAAQNGLTSAGLVDELRDPDVAARTQLSDVVIVTIGANDFDSRPAAVSACGPKARVSCYQRDLHALRVNLRNVLARIRQVHRTRPRVFVTGYWNVFLDGDVGRGQGAAYVANSDALTRAANAVIKDVALGHGARYVDLYAAFKGDGDTDDTGLIAADGDHPSAAGHRLIAHLLQRALAVA